MSRLSRQLRRKYEERDQRKRRPTLSLCMIVKNEAEHLERCLSTARPHVEEIVVVDTGSTDGTREIARRYADVFDEIEWPGSFSIARNHSFDLATSDYILILDGDEHIPKIEHWEALRYGLEQEGYGAMTLRVRNLLPDNQILHSDVIVQERIILNDPEIRYTGRVHNQIVHSILKYCHQHRLNVLNVPAEVIHLGYALSKDRMQEKYTTRLPLLKAEVADAANPAMRVYYVFQLGNAYFMLKDYAKAAETLNELDYDALGDVNGFSARMMATHANLRTGDTVRALVHADAMLSMAPEEPIAYFLSGHVFLARKQFQEAILMMIEAYNRSEQGVDEVRYAIDEPYMFRILADVSNMLGLEERARFFYNEYLKKYPDDPRVREVLHGLEAQAA